MNRCGWFGHKLDWDNKSQMDVFDADEMRIGIRTTVGCIRCDNLYSYTTWHDEDEMRCDRVASKADEG